MPAREARARGPRGGDANTRGDIIAAAADVFGAKGYAAASVREIARAADVDPGLVRHYFGTKADLFVAVMKPLGGDDARVQALRELPSARRGEALLTLVLDLWEDPETGARLRAVLASALSATDVGPAMAGVMMRAVLVGVVRDDDAQVRAAACATQITGLALGRYVLGVPALADASREELTRLFAPTLQRYIDGDLDAPPG